MKVIRLLVVSDETLSRYSLKHLLASEADFEMIGESGYAEAKLLTSRLRPGVVIVIAEAGRQSSCVPLIGSLRKAIPDVGIVVLGRETHNAYLGLLLAAGALGYVLLQASPHELFDAVRAVSSGRRFIDHKIGDELYELFSRQAEAGTKLLSQRERQVLEMLAFGHTLVEIASYLSLSRKSVETYRARIREKLGLRTRAEIVRYALEKGILNRQERQAS